MKLITRRASVIPVTIMALLLLAMVSGCPGLYQGRSTSVPGVSTVSQGQQNTTTTTPIRQNPRQSRLYPASIKGLQNPISIAYTPDGRMFITERTGRIRVVANGKLLTTPFADVNVPNLVGYHETGLLGIATHPNYKANPYVYFYRTYSRNGRLLNRVVRIRDVNGKAQDAQIIIDNIPGGRIHNGGVILFGPDGNLYVATGETGKRDLAQDRNSLAGKVLRVSPNGGIPEDNPISNSAVYSYGHRNIFGMAFRPESGELYITENGPESDDEINKIVPGANYGWPEALGPSNNTRFADPIRTYPTIIAPTQAVFYTGTLLKGYKNWFIFGTYAGHNVRAVEITGTTGLRVGRDKVLYQTNEPVAGVSQSPDGGLYVIKETSIEKLTMLR